MFKVGDKVRVIDYHNIITGKRDERYIGKIGNVTEVTPITISTNIPDAYHPEYTPEGVYFPNELELVKDEFKVGDTVRVINVPGTFPEKEKAYYLGKIGVITSIPSILEFHDCMVDITSYHGSGKTPWNFNELEKVNFGVGDKVRLNLPSLYSFVTAKEGTIVRIPSTTGLYDCNVVADGYPLSLNFSEIEKIKEFVVGARVKVKYVDFNPFIKGKTGTIIANSEEDDKYTVTLDDTSDCPVGARHQKYYLYENELELID